jgi:hypothetical protein
LEGFSVSTQSYDRKQIQDLQAAAKELHELSLGMERAIDHAAKRGEIQAAKDAFSELQIKTAAYEKFRKRVSPEGLFIAKYNIEVYGPHEVSFVLPKGVSRIQILKEAQGLVGERDLISPDDLTKWEKDLTFKTLAKTSQGIRIDGHVAGGDARTRAEQETVLKEKGLQMSRIQDLATAFVAYYIATREPVFGFYKNVNYTFWVRAAGGALLFDSNGLSGCVIGDNYDFDHVAVAAALPRVR